MTLRLLSLADVKLPPACIYYAVSCVWMRQWQGPTPERIAVVIEVTGLWNGELLTSNENRSPNAMVWCHSVRRRLGGCR
jgi:hypothetical protein